MGLAWCLPTGFQTPVTYFYVVYFAVLLIHRQRRDDARCVVKYVQICCSSPLETEATLHRHGKDWDRYQKLVPYRIIPYIY